MFQFENVPAMNNQPKPTIRNEIYAVDQAAEPKRDVHVKLQFLSLTFH